jgi:hypothetical protein
MGLFEVLFTVSQLKGELLMNLVLTALQVSGVNTFRSTVNTSKCVTKSKTLPQSYTYSNLHDMDNSTPATESIAIYGGQ